MTTQYVQPGNTLTLTAPGGGVTAKVPLIIGNLFVLPQVTADAGDDFAALATGVWTVPKATGFTMTAGTTMAYWDVADENVNSDTGNSAVGIAVEDAASGDTECTILVLNPKWVDVSAAAARLDAVEDVIDTITNAGVGDQVNLTDTSAHTFTEKNSVPAALHVQDDIVNIFGTVWVDGVNGTPQFTVEVLMGSTVIDTIVIATAAANDYVAFHEHLKLTAVGASLTAEITSRHLIKDGTVSASGAVQKAKAITASSTAGYDITVRVTSDAGHASNLATLRELDTDIKHAA